MFASKTERYPSPLRAIAGSYGYDVANVLYKCKGDGAAEAVFPYEPYDPRVLYIGVTGTKPFEIGLPPTENEYAATSHKDPCCES